MPFVARLVIAAPAVLRHENLCIIRASQSANVCAGFPKGLVIDVTVDFACCDGDPNPPCLLGFVEFFLSVSALRR